MRVQAPPPLRRKKFYPRSPVTARGFVLTPIFFCPFVQFFAQLTLPLQRRTKQKQNAMNTTTTNPAHLRQLLKLVTAQRDNARGYLRTVQNNLCERNAEVDALKEELRALKKQLAVLAQ